MKYEMVLWFNWFFGLLPGVLFARLRRHITPANVGMGSLIWDGVRIDEPKKLIIGCNTSINRGVLIHSGGGVTIGNNVLIGPKVIIYSQNHNFSNKDELIKNQGYEYKPVEVCDDSWLASNVIICPGVTVGKGCVIGAGSVVTKSTEDYGVYVGNPAVKIKDRF